jgi:uncharacterized cupredoxin-like copper-binding protein
MAESRRARLSHWGIGISLALLAACNSPLGSQPANVVLEVNDTGFQPAVVQIAAGQPVEITLKKTGSVEHQLGIADIPLVTQGGGTPEHDMAGMNGTMASGMQQLRVHMVAAPGAMTAMELTPSMAGEYVLRCVVPGHTEQGKLVVK